MSEPFYPVVSKSHSHLEHSENRWYADPTGLTSNASKGYRLMLTNLNYYTTPNAVRDFASKYGPVAECFIMLCPSTRTSIGIAYVNFQRWNSVILAGARIYLRTLDGARVRPALLWADQYDIVMSQLQKDKILPEPVVAPLPQNLFSVRVSCIINTITETVLAELFGQYGTLVDVFIPRWGWNVKGYAYVRYYSLEEAKAAVKEMNREVVQSVKLRVSLVTRSERLTKKEIKEREERAQRERVENEIWKQEERTYKREEIVKEWLATVEPTIGAGNIQGGPSCERNQEDANLVKMISGDRSAIASLRECRNSNSDSWSSNSPLGEMKQKGDRGTPKNRYNLRPQVGTGDGRQSAAGSHTITTTNWAGTPRVARKDKNRRPATPWPRSSTMTMWTDERRQLRESTMVKRARRDP